MLYTVGLMCRLFWKQVSQGAVKDNILYSPRRPGQRQAIGTSCPGRRGVTVTRQPGRFKMTVRSSVRDPKLIISDPDTKIENQEFRIRIRDPDPGSGSFCELVMVKFFFQFWVITRQKWVEIFNFLNFSRIVYEIIMNFFTF